MAANGFLSPLLLQQLILLIVVLLFSLSAGLENNSNATQATTTTTTNIPPTVNPLIVEWESSAEAREAYHQFCPPDRHQIRMGVTLEELIAKIGVNGVMHCLSQKGKGMFHDIAHRTGVWAASTTNNVDLLWQPDSWTASLYGYFHGATEKLVLVLSLESHFLFPLISAICSLTRSLSISLHSHTLHAQHPINIHTTRIQPPLLREVTTAA